MATLRDRRHRPTAPRRFRRVAIAICAVAASLAACTALQPPRVENANVYTLDVVPTFKAASRQVDVVIAVAPPRAWPGFDSSQMIYVRSPYALEAFAASRWTDAPAHMLGPLLARALEHAASYRAVVQMPTAVATDLRVDTEIVRFQQNFATRPSRAEIAIHVQLSDVRGRRVIASDVFEDAENAASEDAAGGVVAMNIALQRLLERIATFCVDASVAVKPQPHPPLSGGSADQPAPR